MKSEENSQWVFRTIVQDESDVVGLIAYGLYKISKDEKCQAWRDNGFTEEEIRAKAKHFHDMVITGNREMEHYRNGAALIFDRLMAPSDKVIERKLTALKESHQKELASLKKQHDAEVIKAKKNAISEFTKKVGAHTLSAQHWSKKLGLWVVSGVPSMAATFLAGILFLFIASLFSSSAEKAKSTASFVNGVVGSNLVAPLANDEVLAK